MCFLFSYAIAVSAHRPNPAHSLFYKFSFIGTQPQSCVLYYVQLLSLTT